MSNSGNTNQYNGMYNSSGMNLGTYNPFNNSTLNTSNPLNNKYN